MSGSPGKEREDGASPPTLILPPYSKSSIPTWGLERESLAVKFATLLRKHGAPRVKVCICLILDDGSEPLGPTFGLPSAL